MTEKKKLTPRQKQRRRYNANVKKRKKDEKAAKVAERLSKRARKNRDFGAGCYNKQGYETLNMAKAAIRAVFHKKPNVKYLSIYQCRWCHDYHLTSGKPRAGKSFYVYSLTREEWDQWKAIKE